MIGRRDVLRNLLVVPLSSTAAAVAFGVAGCGQNEGLPAIPLNKSKDESQKENEQLPGIPVQDSRKKK